MGRRAALPGPGDLLARVLSLAPERRLAVIAKRRAGANGRPEAVELDPGGEGLGKSLPESAGVPAEGGDEGGAVGLVADEREQRRFDLLLAVEEHLLLGGEIVEDGLARHVGSGGDIVDGHRGEAAITEEVGRRLGDRGAGLAFLGLSKAGHL